MVTAMGREAMEAQCAGGVVEGRVELVSPVDPAAIDAHHHLCAGFATDNEDSPQQATGYQKENRLMMRNHGFSNSSL